MMITVLYYACFIILCIILINSKNRKNRRLQYYELAKEDSRPITTLLLYVDEQLNHYVMFARPIREGKGFKKPNVVPGGTNRSENLPNKKAQYLFTCTNHNHGQSNSKPMNK